MRQLASDHAHPNRGHEAYLTHELSDDGDERVIEFVGPRSLRLRAARTRLTSRRIYRLFVMLFEGRYDELSPFELALVAETHSRNPSVYGRVLDLWRDDDPAEPRLIDYAAALRPSGAILMGDRARRAAVQAARERRRRCWKALVRRAPVDTNRPTVARPCAMSRSRGVRFRPSSRRQPSASARSSGSDPGEPEPASPPRPAEHACEARRSRRAS